MAGFSGIEGGVTFEQGQVLEQGDLDIFIEDSTGNPINVVDISYALYFVDPQTAQEVLIGPARRIPVNPTVGEYYASLMVPSNADPGGYRIRWTFRETVSSPTEGAVQEFGVLADSPVTLGHAYSNCVQDLINKMRFMTGDNDPDRHYRFRPPEGEGDVGCYNQVFGRVFSDEEFAQFLEMALWKWNMAPPNTECAYRNVDSICSKRPSWQAALLWGALVHAAQMMAYVWIQNEFGYSIGGISLDIERSSKYMDLKHNAEEQWTKLTEFKTRTEKYVKGLAQPRFGRGVRSSFGPHTGRGVLSPRSFIVFCLSVGYPVLQEALAHANHLSPLLA